LSVDICSSKLNLPFLISVFWVLAVAGVGSLALAEFNPVVLVFISESIINLLFLGIVLLAVPIEEIKIIIIILIIRKLKYLRYDI